MESSGLSLAGVVCGVVVTGLASVRAAELDLTIVGGDTGRTVPARVRIRDAEGKDHVPEGAQMVPVGKRDRWFASDGRVRLSLPAGSIGVRIERGTEYKPIKQTIEIADDGPNTRQFKLIRWVNMGERGYVCGENHLHVKPEELAPQVVAEGLDFGTSLQWWNYQRWDLPLSNGGILSMKFAGVRVPCSLCDAEIEHAWGAAYIIGVPHPLYAKRDDKRPNLPIVRQTHEAGAVVCYQGGWSREVLLDALLGYVDVVNVCNNNFHRHAYQPRTRYSNLLNVEGFPEYPGTPSGMMQMNTDTYYRLLNCGLQLAAGAGSATGAKHTPVGYNRAYVRAGEKPTMKAFLDAWRQGRNFVTCGPMIFLTVNGKHKPGDTIGLGAEGGSARIEVEAVSDQPLTSLEVVVNGEVVGQASNLSGSKAKLQLTTDIGEGSWIAARCTDRDKLLSDEELEANYSYGNARMPCRPCRMRFAHTSPVYVTVEGKGVRVEASVAEARRMLDAFEVFADETVGDAHRGELSAAIKRARGLLAD